MTYGMDVYLDLARIFLLFLWRRRILFFRHLALIERLVYQVWNKNNGLKLELTGCMGDCLEIGANFDEKFEKILSECMKKWFRHVTWIIVYGPDSFELVIS